MLLQDFSGHRKCQKEKKKNFAVTVTSGRFQGRCGTRPPRRRERETVVISVNAKR